MEASKGSSQSTRQTNRQLDFGFSKEKTETELAYYAGLFDGEGNVDISDYTKGHRFQRLRVQVSQKPRLLLENLKHDFGGSIYPHKNGCAGWCVYGASAKAFLLNILPYLRLKKEEAEHAISFQSLVNPPGGHRHILEYQQKLRDDLITKKIKARISS